jgi:hypothetical protein
MSLVAAGALSPADHFTGRRRARSALCWADMCPSALRPSGAPPPPTGAVPSPASPASNAWNADSPAVIYEAPGLLLTHWKNFAIHLWTGRASLAMVMRLDELSPPFATAHPRGFSSVHIIAQGTPLPDRDVRNALRNLTNKYAKNIGCVCHVVEGAGFWASALRSFLTGFHFGPREPFDLHICATLEMAAQHVPQPHSQRTGVFVATNEFEAALKAVRSRAG